MGSVLEALTNPALKDLNLLLQQGFHLPGDFVARPSPLKLTVSKSPYEINMHSGSFPHIFFFVSLEHLKETFTTAKQSVAKWAQLLPLILPFWLQEHHLNNTKSQKGMFWENFQHHEVILFERLYFQIHLGFHCSPRTGDARASFALPMLIH